MNTQPIIHRHFLSDPPVIQIKWPERCPFTPEEVIAACDVKGLFLASAPFKGTLKVSGGHIMLLHWYIMAASPNPMNTEVWKLALTDDFILSGKARCQCTVTCGIPHPPCGQPLPCTIHGMLGKSTQCNHLSRVIPDSLYVYGPYYKCRECGHFVADRRVTVRREHEGMAGFDRRRGEQPGYVGRRFYTTAYGSGHSQDRRQCSFGRRYSMRRRGPDRRKS